jgi:hypothetical protein
MRIKATTCPRLEVGSKTSGSPLDSRRLLSKESKKNSTAEALSLMAAERKEMELECMKEGTIGVRTLQ